MPQFEVPSPQSKTNLLRGALPSARPAYHTHKREIERDGVYTGEREGGGGGQHTHTHTHTHSHQLPPPLTIETSWNRIDRLRLSPEDMRRTSSVCSGVYGSMRERMCVSVYMRICISLFTPAAVHKKKTLVTTYTATMRSGSIDRQ